MSNTPQRAPDRELLLANHDFPGSYTIKVFGPASPEFRSGVEEAWREVYSAQAVESSERTTRSGGGVCVTLELRTDTVDEVIALYERLYDIPQLRLIL